MSVTANPESVADTEARQAPATTPLPGHEEQTLIADGSMTEIVVPEQARTSGRRRRKTDLEHADNSAQAALQQELQEARKQIAVQKAIAEQARRVSECQLAFQQALLEQIPQPCFVLDENGTILFWNPAMAAWSGHPGSAVHSLPLTQIADPQSASMLLNACRIARFALEHGEPSPRREAFTLPQPLTLDGKLQAEITVIPRCRIPGHVESFVVLAFPIPQE
ncbi:MAG: PAS domain-containing protein [Chloroherpetonaceae bacterium]|nr:PAS domain-containing protein [Chthonomonadaceae bacterium]MDW8207076.1 PAS domain-containing protein [Chloroherpetonaceae bacterium]